VTQSVRPIEPLAAARKRPWRLRPCAGLGLILAMALAGGASAELTADAAVDTAAGVAVEDPLRPLNRGLFTIDTFVNDTLAGRGRLLSTAKWIPRPVRAGLYNALDNLDEPATFANDLFQRKAGRAIQTGARFGVNTTIGVLGVFDPASGMGLKRTREDFGQTLAVYGVSPGPYLFVPFSGPSNFRDKTGAMVDGVFSPLHWVSLGLLERRAIKTGKVLVKPATLGIRQQARAAAAAGETADEYATLRGLYAEQRAAQIADLPNLADNPIAAVSDRAPNQTQTP
jgi:phospholipid-binding lipoprotein MlaA